MMLTLTAELRRATERCVWFETPEHAVQQPERLAAYILTYGAFEDVRALRAQLSNEDLKALLDRAPAGIFDARSWSYWNLVVGRPDPPALPSRVIAAI